MELIQFNYSKAMYIALLLLLGILFYFFLYEYFIFSTTSLFGMALVPYLNQRNDTKSIRYLWLTLLFIGLSLLVHANTFFYLAWISALLFLVESNSGKTNKLVGIMLLLISPISNFFSNFFGIPARLFLTSVAGNILQLMGMEATVAGNVININAHEFSVDPACMGLHMLTMSYIVALFYVAYHEKQAGKQINRRYLLLLVLVIFLFSSASNLCRIILLVLFAIPAEYVAHDATGIFCFALYVLLPLWPVTKWLVYKSGESKAEKSCTNHYLTQVLGCLLALVLSYTGNIVHKEVIYQNNTFKKCAIAGFERENIKSGVIKFENNHVLIYVKPIKSFYSAEHSPMICWVGSGYDFKKIRKIEMNGKEVYTGILQKGNDVLFTSWWFDNGTSKTCNQTDWRWDVLTGADNYSIVNVSAVSEAEMLNKTSALLMTNIFR